MVGSVTGSQSSSILADLSPQSTTSSVSTDSFMAQLSSALEGYLAQSSNNSNLEIDIQSTQSQNSGVRQFLVTVKNPDSASAPTSTAASGGVAPAASAASPADSPAPTDSTAPAATPTNEVDAYWAMQPPEVQVMRDIPDIAGRSAMAQTLTAEGFTIDTQIMVWGWDPKSVMLARESYGYAWAPHWGQQAEPTQNDASSGPPGSIPVNTDFLNGLSS